MKNWDWIILIIGTFTLLGSIEFAFWWSVNGPYCCIYQCGVTENMVKCLPGMLTPIFAIIGICLIIGSFYADIREK